jgi:hypothetical protein
MASSWKDEKSQASKSLKKLHWDGNYQKFGLKMRTGLNWLRVLSDGELCKRSNENACSTKGEELICVDVSLIISEDGIS